MCPGLKSAYFNEKNGVDASISTRKFFQSGQLKHSFQIPCGSRIKIGKERKTNSENSYQLLKTDLFSNLNFFIVLSFVLMLIPFSRSEVSMSSAVLRFELVTVDFTDLAV